MKISIMACLILLLGLNSFGISAVLEPLSMEILEEIWSFHPIGATYLGIHKYDKYMPDYSRKALDSKLKKLKALHDRLIELDTLTLSADELVDYYLLRASLCDEIFDIEKSRVYENDPLVYSRACVNGVYTIMIRHAESVRAKMVSATLRLNQIPKFLEVARQNLRRPSYLLCEAAIDQLTEGERFIEEIFEYYKDSVEIEERLNLKQATIQAVASMMSFAYWLEQNQDPQKIFILGEEKYNYKLKNVHLVDITADSILKIGKHYLLWTESMIDSLDDMLAPARQERVVLPFDFGPQSVVAYRTEELSQLREFVAGSELVTIPDFVGKIEIVETPGFLAGLVPGAAMMPPGPFDRSRRSRFFTPRLPRKFDLAEAEYFYNYIYNRWFLGAAIHEAYPGHHLQLSIANNHSSSVRRGFRTFFFVEGWALYCEELMVASGLFEDTIGALINALDGVRYRAARIVVDVNLQTGVFGYDDALRFMVDTFGGSDSYYAREIKRYLGNPIQPSSYLVGKLQINDLMDECREMWGDNFDLKDFHDELLSHGSIPLKLHRMLMRGGR
ncbi:MAG: DUF885 domain-containing protein [candidate division WOR-3 bacterium]|nr:MAG: DUF885 domain-containing protein [candidate division WOR-3 bacterium]